MPLSITYGEIIDQGQRVSDGRNRSDGNNMHAIYFILAKHIWET